jgi:hypothetical protein|tara:strand:+ start:353 stop:655 length:303 start_codon:yes stop_codon:yes gene_type:complete
MKYKQFKLNGQTQTYFPPDMVCSIPSSLDQEEKDLIRVFMRRDIHYVTSAQIVLAAERNGNYVDIKESDGLIEYMLRKKDLRLERIIQNMADGGKNETKN